MFSTLPRPVVSYVESLRVVVPAGAEALAAASLQMRAGIAGRQLSRGATIRRRFLAHRQVNEWPSKSGREDELFINADEAIKRLAAAQGIDVLNLVKSMDQQQEEAQVAQEQQQEMELTKQAAALESAPINDPSKNPALAAELEQQQPPM